MNIYRRNEIRIIDHSGINFEIIRFIDPYNWEIYIKFKNINDLFWISFLESQLKYEYNIKNLNINISFKNKKTTTNSPGPG